MNETWNWTYQEHLQLWPNSERLNAVIQSGRFDNFVYTMPGVKYSQPLIDKMAYAFCQITDRQLKRETVSCDLNGLKHLIVSFSNL